MRFVYFAVALIVSLAKAQTETGTDANGNTVVELLTLNAAGLPTTSIISTIAPAAAQQQQPVQQGPVGAPAPTPNEAGLPTPFQYTTTDEAGNTQVIDATFIPSFVSVTTPPPPTTTGTVLDLSAFLSVIGTNTVPVNAATSVRWHVPGKSIAIGVGLAAGAIGGVFLVLF